MINNIGLLDIDKNTELNRILLLMPSLYSEAFEQLTRHDELYVFVDLVFTNLFEKDNDSSYFTAMNLVPTNNFGFRDMHCSESQQRLLLAEQYKERFSEFIDSGEPGRLELVRFTQKNIFFGFRIISEMASFLSLFGLRRAKSAFSVWYEDFMATWQGITHQCMNLYKELDIDEAFNCQFDGYTQKASERMRFTRVSNCLWFQAYPRKALNSKAPELALYDAIYKKPKDPYKLWTYINGGRDG